MSDVLVVTAYHLQRELEMRTLGDTELTLLYVLSSEAPKGKPIALRIDFPGEPTGGFEMRFRRMGPVSRLLWWLGFGGGKVGL